MELIPSDVISLHDMSYFPAFMFYFLRGRVHVATYRKSGREGFCFCAVLFCFVLLPEYYFCKIINSSEGLCCNRIVHVSTGSNMSG